MVGCGWAARTLHVPSLRRSGVGRIVAAADPLPRSRENLGADRTFDDWATMLREVDCDAVLITSSPEHHIEPALAALTAGRHVLLEKPVSPTMAEALRLQQAARGSDRVVALAFNQRCHSGFRRLREQITRGELGTIDAIHVRWSTGAGLGARGWIGERSRGGGCLLDLGSHIVDLCRFLTASEPDRITAVSRSVTVDDESGRLEGTFSNGTRLSAELSIVGGDEFEVVVEAGRRRVRIRPYGRDFHQSYDEQWRAFARAVLGNGPPTATLDDGIRSLEWILGATANLPVCVRHPWPAVEFPLSVISSTTVGYAAIRTTVAHLRRQSIVNEMELVMVGPSEESLAAPAEEFTGFAAVTRVSVGPVMSIAHANAAGVRRARGRVVALTEDHCFPEPEWAAALLVAHQDDRSVVGPMVRNGNPQTLVSQADFIIGYGPWMEPISGQEMPFLPGHNSSYKRDELLALGGRLERLMEAETVLHMEWSAQGKCLWVEPAARVRHMNYSLWRSWIPVQVLAGRVFGGMRASGWPRRRQLFYAAASPLIPAVRFWRSLRELRRPGWTLGGILRIAPVLACGLILDGVGQFLGYWLGPGDAVESLARYEFNRVDHVQNEERSLWTSP
jgi:predicted dehydrogenase